MTHLLPLNSSIKRSLVNDWFSEVIRQWKESYSGLVLLIESKSNEYSYPLHRDQALNRRYSLILTHSKVVLAFEDQNQIRFWQIRFVSHFPPYESRQAFLIFSQFFIIAIPMPEG